MRLPALVAAAMLAAAAPGCASDNAAKKDANKAAKKAEKDASKAKKDAEDAAKDVDGN
jgi:hypothetical protein